MLVEASPLKTHIPDKWVSSTDTSSSMSIPDFISLRFFLWMQIEQEEWASAQFENVNFRLEPAFDPKPCSLVFPNALSYSAKWRMERNCENLWMLVQWTS